MPVIHCTAVVSPRARLGRDVQVGPHAYVAGDVVLGDGCTIGPNACVLPYTIVGPRCRLHAGAIVGDLPQDVSFQGVVSHCRIGDGCVIREGVTIHRGTTEGSVTEVGDECLLMANSHVGHDARLGARVVLTNGSLVAGYAEIHDGAILSGNCLVHQFTRIGRLAMMTGGSAVQKDLPPFCMTRSVSANTVMGLNVIGLRRAGLTPADRNKLKWAFDVLYRSGLPVSKALSRLAGDDHPLVREFHEFVASSRRGVCKFFQDADGDADASARSAA